MRYISKLLLLLKNYIFTLLLFFYLCIIAFLPNDFIFSGSIALSIIALLFLNLVLGKGKWYISLIPNLLFVLFISFSAFFSFMYSSWIWTESILSILRTNSSEASEMIKTFLFPGILSIGVTVGLVLLSQREMKQTKTPLLYISFFVVCGYSFLFLPFMINRIIERIEYRTIWDSSVMNSQYANMYAPIFYGNIVATYAAVKELGKIKELLKVSASKENPVGITLGDASSPYKRIVVVVGESSSKSHYSLYGYDRKTTPFLDSLKNESTFTYFDAISPASSTVLSLFRSLSFATLQDVSAAYKTKSVIDLAHDMGYTTYWLSAQDPIGESNSEIGLLALSTDEQYYLDRRNEGKGLDIHLLPLFKEHYAREEKQLIILHLMGSHIYYSARIDELDRVAIEDSDRNTNAYNSVDDYDRSVHHTDRVLRDVYEALKCDTTSLMLYASDHAEIVGLGHGYNKEYKKQHEIPFLTYNFTSHPSNSTIYKYSTKDDKRFNTVNMSYVLAEYLGYSISDSLVVAAVSEAPKILLQSGKVVDFETVIDK